MTRGKVQQARCIQYDLRSCASQEKALCTPVTYLRHAASHPHGRDEQTVEHQGNDPSGHTVMNRIGSVQHLNCVMIL